VAGNVVRTFGSYSGKKEIEAIAVDNELGYVYYSDEQFGVRKYYAHPDSSSSELVLFATTGVVDDHEGISIYKNADGTGYLMLSDQQGQRFHIYTREGTGSNPHDHSLVKIVDVAALESDGSDVTNVNLGANFPNGLFVAMSDDKTFHFYRWEDFFNAGK
jgi:3-phytase